MSGPDWGPWSAWEATGAGPLGAIFRRHRRHVDGTVQHERRAVPANAGARACELSRALDACTRWMRDHGCVPPCLSEAERVLADVLAKDPPTAEATANEAAALILGAYNEGADPELGRWTDADAQRVYEALIARTLEANP